MRLAIVVCAVFDVVVVGRAVIVVLVVVDVDDRLEAKY